MEYASGGELYDYLNRMKRIPESQARAIFRQIVSAVHFLHKVYRNSIFFHLFTLLFNLRIKLFIEILN
jgi:serine/threonine protein kinase